MPNDVDHVREWSGHSRLFAEVFSMMNLRGIPLLH